MNYSKATASTSRSVGKHAVLWREIVKHRVLYLFISPFYILFAVFGLFPIIFSFYLAFNKWDGIGKIQFTGLNQFRYMITDSEFWKAIGNTLEIWVYSTIPMLIMALLIAYLLNAAFLRYRTFYRIAYFLPNVTSIVAVAIVFGTLFGNKYGLLNYVLSLMGIGTVEWLNSAFGIKIAIASMVVWRWTGYNAIIYLAGLQSIPTVLYEAARIDGASTWQIFTKITVPLVRPIILFTVITSTIGGMQIFTESQVLTGNTGGPGGAGMTIVLYLYQLAFVKYLFGYASTVAWGLFVIIAAFSYLNYKLVDKPGA
ncbi:carbohydrate ABC transporter permease [Paenibacillus xerothermodurans]|uniref:Sugar ABC transporter permease n=1 Tax=Paenibacillus xerothermodurans TaxID=1977292 RepID=A0A2W1N6I7_PAEXE|nr:sugar ABC transporter permease [Paenibacillus xerothermodurans]PZE19250.1 sugar ABC transporter permease [Paenibacillus xerothermodurans]